MGIYEELGGVAVEYKGVKTACCSEQKNAANLMNANPNLKIKQIDISKAIRPKSGKIIKACPLCTEILPQTKAN